MNINDYIDHTALKPNVSKDDINSLIKEAKTYNFSSICVNPHWVGYAAEQLKATNVNVCTVIGFPLGANTTQTKVFETENAITNGATEIDMVINISELLAKNYDYVENEIKEIKNVCENRILKVIVETCLLSEEEKKKVCSIVMNSGADFIKTSTGFNGGGATQEDIKLFKSIGGDNLLIKASGGVRTYEDAIKMIEAGANRIGTSGGVSIINGKENTSSY